jgi:DNA invertase Pin-like site-specific DNA recombinase
MRWRQPMIVGYARTSTVDQEAGFEAQKRDLEAAGCTRMFSEQLSSVDAQRPQLEAALEFVREGDTFVVTKLDRLARSVGGFVKIVGDLERKKVALRILALGLDTSTATGRLTLNVMSSVAQFEREIMLERQREGIAKAKAEGKYKGRRALPATIVEKIKAMRTAGCGATEIAEALKIGRATVYRLDKLAAFVARPSHTTFLDQEPHDRP